MSSPHLERMKEAARPLHDRNRPRGTAPWCGREHDLGAYAIAYRTSYLSDSTQTPLLAEHELVPVARAAPPRPADLAALIEDRSARLVEDRDFRGYYNSSIGEGASAHDVSGTGVVLDMQARREGK
jgi:hypothetical protein